MQCSGEIRGTGNAAYTYNATKQYEDDGEIGEENKMRRRRTASMFHCN